MNKKIRVMFFVFIFSVGLFIPRLNATQEMPWYLETDTTISMDLQDAPLKDILKILSIQSGLNFIASEAVQDRKVTLYMDKVPLRDAMNKIFKANNLSYELDRDSNVFTVKDWGKNVVETVTKVFYLKYATVSSASLNTEHTNYINSTTSQVGSSTSSNTSTSSTSSTGTTTGTTTTGTGTSAGNAGITEAVKKNLSDRIGSVIEDPRTNSLIVTDTPVRMATISQVIAAIDTPSPQILLEVEMLDVTKGTIDKLGLRFGDSGFTMSFPITTPKLASTKFPFGALFGEHNSSVTAGTLGPGSVTATIDFIKNDTDTKFLARPKILTLNNETAEVKITTQETVGAIQNIVNSGGAPVTASAAERMETGVSLRVTPQINPETGEVTMFVMPTVKEASTATGFTINGNAVKDPEERSTRSLVRVKDGETVVLGGLLRTRFNQVYTNIPYFSKLPIIGTLFRNKNKDKDEQRELLVFITPHIVKSKTEGLKLAQAAPSVNLKLPVREQEAVSAINREQTIKSDLEAYEKKR